MKPKRNFRWTSVALAVPLAAILFLGIFVEAEGHSRYLRSKPGQDAVVATEPMLVEIWFTQDLFRRAGENWINVFGPNGDEVQKGDAKIDDDDRRRLWIELQSPLTPGEYQVEWRNLSAEDGDTDEGQFSFLFDPEAKVTSTPMQDATDTPFPDSEPESATEPAETPESTVVRPPEESGGCALGLAPPIGMLALGIVARRWKR